MARQLLLSSLVALVLLLGATPAAGQEPSPHAAAGADPSRQVQWLKEQLQKLQANLTVAETRYEDKKADLETERGLYNSTLTNLRYEKTSEWWKVGIPSGAFVLLLLYKLVVRYCCFCCCNPTGDVKSDVREAAQAARAIAGAV